MPIVKTSSKGQVVIPAEIREKIGLKPGGRAAILTFHSGEDRRVKKSFQSGERSGAYSEVSHEVLRATSEELRANPRSRSAKLRWARRSAMDARNDLL